MPEDVLALGAGGDDRQGEVVAVLSDAFASLIEADPRAFRRKFRKMAADPFAFYRGSAPLFYADVVRLEDPWADERTGRVWIQGDLHAENYGTYMDAAGQLVFDVNDFDEAYVGHFRWALRRMAASLAATIVATKLDRANHTQAIDDDFDYVIERVQELKRRHLQDEMGDDRVIDTAQKVIDAHRTGSSEELDRHIAALDGAIHHQELTDA